MSEPFIKRSYYVMSLDPVHIGTGGYRLGRVDNTIIREPGTNIPKIPGSSIAGVTRAYTAMAVQCEHPLEFAKQKYQQIKIDENGEPVIKKDKDGNPLIDSDGQQQCEYISCAGKGSDDGDGHCGKPDCEVCVPFGFSKQTSSFQGLAQFYDARILFFPVHSMIGPVWVTSPCIMSEHGLSLTTFPDDSFKSFGLEVGDKLNFGWLMLSKEKSDVNLPSVFCDVPNEVKNRLLLVSDKLFARIVNDNLEVRTSVAIDPATGAAESGALFTYEAIPRATVMWFDVVYNRPEYFMIDGQGIIKNLLETADVDWIKGNVEKGFGYIESLGVGGMNTRGMGRMRVYI